MNGNSILVSEIHYFYKKFINFIKNSIILYTVKNFSENSLDSLKYKWVVNFSKDVDENIFDIELEIVPTVWSEKYPVH